jgi:hypothetical protein
MGHATIQTTMIYIHHVLPRDEAGCTRVHSPPPRTKTKIQKAPICRQNSMPEEGLEPPTRGL